jgi:hypothetical protein
MAIAQKHVGEDVKVYFNFEISTGVYLNLDDATEVFACLSNGANQILFSKAGGTGYQTLIRIDAYNYMAMLTSANTITLDVGHVKFSAKANITSVLGDLKDTYEVETPVLYLSANKLQSS